MRNITNTYVSWPLFISLLLYLGFLFNSLSCISINNSSDSSLDQVILDCGSEANSSLFNSKTWAGDANFFQDYNYFEGTTIGRVVSNTSGMPAPEIPYSTARFFRSSFTYSFPMSPGLKFIRLHFYPNTSYTAIRQISKADFSVTWGNFTLLNHFSPSVWADILNSPYFTKDYFLNLKDHFLNITFAPSSHDSDDFAFVNGIEIYSMPLKLSDYGVINEASLEILYRVNVGADTPYLPFWNGLDDQQYMQGVVKGTRIESYNDNIVYNKSSWTLRDYLNIYRAPDNLYSTARSIGSSNDAANLTWAFLVDSGFQYIVRLHFCEIEQSVTEANQRVFKVYINNKITDRVDVIAAAGGPLMAMHKDYIITAPKGNEEGNTLRIALRPDIDSKPKRADVILNGIEIMKLSDASNNLGAHVEVKHIGKSKKIPSNAFLGLILGLFLGLCTISLIVCMVSRSISRRVGAKAGKTTHNLTIVKSSEQCRQFSLEEIRAATDNFSEALELGRGGFGKVYKGLLNDGITRVAVKRKNSDTRQGAKEFKTEIELLTTLRHMNVVSLLGYCQEGNEMILVYDYMANGSLRDHLFDTQKPPLSWTQRLEICIGAARGLHYLHTGTEHSIIHRDIKSSNILLGEDWVAKISDFGLSKVGKLNVESFRNQVSPGPKGTFGYLDPEYGRNKTLTRKSDVYSFGVVLFEVLCARPAVNREAAAEQDQTKASLARWVVHCYQSEKLELLIEPFLRGKITSECLTTFVEIAVRCLASRQIDRPSIGDVLHKLEHALLLQEKANSSLEING